MEDSNWQTGAASLVLEQRALMLKSIRAFFDEQGVLEVETPLLSQAATTDPYLDSFLSHFRELPCYLNTSPEYAMKRLLASERRAIYQVCKAFRDDEFGQYHNPEFSMLEWYRPGFDSIQLMQEIEALVIALGESFPECQKSLSFSAVSYQQAFESVTRLNPHRATIEQCVACAKANGIAVPQGMALSGSSVTELNQWLDWLLTQLVLPSFNRSAFTFLYDYPATQCALARVERNEDEKPVAKRFELFFGEIELANGFDELTDAKQQQERFEQDNKIRQHLGKSASPVDMRLIAALDHGLPQCSGVALGLDRLLMVLGGYESIEQVLSFSWLQS